MNVIDELTNEKIKGLKIWYRNLQENLNIGEK
jgi:hypothetical protein